MKKYILATALVATASTAALAQNNAQSNDDAALQSAKISVAEAIQAAEKQAGGKAASADFEVADQGGAPHYVVEVIGADGKEQKLAVDATSGQVTAAIDDEDKDGDNDGDGEK